jgi:hypothetical protein
MFLLSIYLVSLAAQLTFWANSIRSFWSPFVSLVSIYDYLSCQLGCSINLVGCSLILVALPFGRQSWRLFLGVKLPSLQSYLPSFSRSEAFFH